MGANSAPQAPRPYSVSFVSLELLTSAANVRTNSLLRILASYSSPSLAFRGKVQRRCETALIREANGGVDFFPGRSMLSAVDAQTQGMYELLQQSSEWPQDFYPRAGSIVPRTYAG
jgi:hypothetical protein